MAISIIANASAHVAGVIRSAARSTGASFEYLLTARALIQLNPAAQAVEPRRPKGLYQFIDQTWLATLKLLVRRMAMASMPTHHADGRRPLRCGRSAMPRAIMKTA